MFALRKQFVFSAVLLAFISGCTTPVYRPAARPEPARADSDEWWLSCASAEAGQLVVDQNQSRLADFRMANQPDHAMIKVDLYRRIADMHTAAGRIDQARAMINQALPLCRWIYRQNNPDSYTSKLAGSMARYGDFAQASALAGRIYRDTDRERAYMSICEIQAARGDLGAGRETLAMIKEDQWQVQALARMAIALSNIGDPRARDVMTEATSRLSNLTGVSFIRNMASIVAFWSKNQGQRQVERILERAQSAISENCDNEDRIWGYTEIGVGYMSIGDDRLAAKYFEKVLECILGGEVYFRNGPQRRSTRLASLVDAQASAGDWQGATTSADKIESPLVKARAKTSIARLMVQAKIEIGIKNAIESALADAITLVSVSDRDEVLGEIAGIYAQTGDLRGIKDTISKMSDKSNGAAAMADYYVARGDLVSAIAAIKELIPPERQTSNAKLAILESRVGNYSNTIKIVDEISSLRDRADIYLQVAEIFRPKSASTMPTTSTSQPEGSDANPQSQPSPLNITAVGQLSEPQRKEQYDLRIGGFQKYLDEEKWTQANDELNMAELIYPDGKMNAEIDAHRKLMKYRMYLSMGMSSARVGDWKLALGCFQSAQEAIDNAEIRQLIEAVKEKMGQTPATSKPARQDVLPEQPIPTTQSKPANWHLPASGDFQ